MIFEEALKLLREGKKIRHPCFADDEYLMGCYVTIGSYYSPQDVEAFELLKEREISITWMLGENLHPRMKPLYVEFNDASQCHPRINLLLLTSDEWEIYERK